MEDNYDQPTGGDNGFGRVPPNNIEAEQSVLGGMLLSKEAIADVSEIFGPLAGSAFYKPVHATIYETIIHLYSTGEAVDPIIVNAELVKRGESQRTGGASYLHSLVQATPTAANASYYAEIVYDKARLRRLIEATTRATQIAYAEEGEVGHIIDAAQQEVFSATQVAQAEDYNVIGDLLEGALDEVESLAARQGEGLSGVPTGYADLDALTHGLQPGQMVVIAARPAMGKSTCALDWARCAAIKNNLPTAIFSLEMGRNELVMRVLSAEARVGLHHMRSGSLTEDDWTRLARRMPEVSQAPLYIDDSPNLSMAEIRSKCRRLVQRNGLKLVIIDYLQLMQGGFSKRSESRQQEVSDISRNIKLMAKELSVPVVALSQLNRGPEQRTDKRPMVSDLRESGSIEQDADMVILLHREDAYDKESPRAGEADVIVAKHRNGPTATVTVAFQGHYSRFVDMAAT